MQVLGLEYLRFADGLERTRREQEGERRHAELLEMIVKAGLAATGDYQEKILFREYFPDEDGSPQGESQGDADVDFDYSDVDFGVPSESELEVLTRMLADDSVTISGDSLEGPESDVPGEEAEQSALPPPRAFDPGDVEQDTEWV